ncbi:hypothetical protein P8452_32775 [Trifolium repens]|nr:hypothetical protein P8452_32775 [Trifolium repens]
MIDEGSDDQGHASADEIEEGAENMMTEAVQKEKRTKKRHDRPSASEEDQNPAKPAKRLKTRASKPKGKISESNTSSIPVAQARIAAEMERQRLAEQEAFKPSYVKELALYDLHSGTFLPWCGFGESAFAHVFSDLILVDNAGNQYMCFED